ncbi:MAG: hypothetical protein IID32_10800 [Planctomycetes bacterium]|nr:hypothetical protein [Planctomycetota bacterium]
MTHYGGMVFDVEKGFLTEKWGDKIEANFFLGPCEAKYDPQSRELSVKVVIENFVLDDGVNTMEGNFHDQLIGTISKDGKTWQTTWTSKGGITGSGTDTPEPRELTFTKTSGEIKIEEN